MIGPPPSVSEVVMSTKVTVPLGVPPALAVTVAVNVTDVPVATGLSDDTTEVVVLALLTVCPGLSEPVLAPKEPSVLVKAALTLWGEPATVSVEVEVVAAPPDNLIGAPAVPSIVNMTEPVALFGETVAVNVTN